MGGVDVEIYKDWFFNVSTWNIDIDTEATLKLRMRVN